MPRESEESVSLQAMALSAYRVFRYAAGEPFVDAFPPFAELAADSQSRWIDAVAKMMETLETMEGKSVHEAVNVFASGNVTLHGEPMPRRLGIAYEAVVRHIWQIIELPELLREAEETEQSWVDWAQAKELRETKV
jgi:hypothetical protein